MKKNIYTVLINFLILLFWQIIATIINAHYILPTPIQIVQKIWELKEPLFMVHLPYTMMITCIGLFISIILGVFLALIMDINENIKNIIYPMIVA